MKINEISFIDIVPEIMRSDRNIKGFAAAWDKMQALILSRAKWVNPVEYLEEMDERLLDKIAEALKIPWYETNYLVPAKIKTIRNFNKVCQMLGTKEAVETVLADIFNGCVAIEWYEYGGNLFRFKVVISNMPEDLDINTVIRYIYSVKPMDALLDSIEQTGIINTTIWVNPFVSSYYKGTIDNIIQPQESSAEIVDDSAGHGFGIVSNKKMQILT